MSEAPCPDPRSCGRRCTTCGTLRPASHFPADPPEEPRPPDEYPWLALAALVYVLLSLLRGLQVLGIIHVG